MYYINSTMEMQYKRKKTKRYFKARYEIGACTGLSQDMCGKDIVEFGRFTGLKPKQIACKAFNSIEKQICDLGIDTENLPIRFEIIEKRHGHDDKIYYYEGLRATLKIPVIVNITKDNGEHAVIAYTRKSQIIKKDFSWYMKENARERIRLNEMEKNNKKSESEYEFESESDSGSDSESDNEPNYQYHRDIEDVIRENQQLKSKLDNLAILNDNLKTKIVEKNNHIEKIESIIVNEPNSTDVTK